MLYLVFPPCFFFLRVLVKITFEYFFLAFISLQQQAEEIGGIQKQLKMNYHNWWSYWNILCSGKQISGLSIKRKENMILCISHFTSSSLLHQHWYFIFAELKYDILFSVNCALLFVKTWRGIQGQINSMRKCRYYELKGQINF